MRRVLFTGFAWATLISAAGAHPVPKSNHDRTIVVRLQPNPKPGHVSIRVDYRLEVDEATVLLEDMLPFRDDIDFAKYRNKPLEFYAEYARIYAPILAGNLLVKLNGTNIKLVPGAKSQRLTDEETGLALGHLRCDFAFEAVVPVRAADTSTLSFRENNFLLQEGEIRTSFKNEAQAKIEKLTAPDEALQKRPPQERSPVEDELLRQLQVVFLPAAIDTPSPMVPEPAPAQPAPEAPTSSFFSGNDSLYAVMTSDAGFWWKMLLAGLFGAAHALTPGHGKTLVAAYLIGQRGTVWHALMLGIVTTLTHTGTVLALAGVLFFLPTHLKAGFAQSMQQGLGLAAGLMVVCLGFWLLLQRAAGRADHVHLPGGHSHGEPTPTDPNATGVRWWGLVVLGVTGGLIPCWDAIILFLYFVGRGEFWIVLPALVSFSAGLAAVLVLIGVMVVQVPKFARSRLGDGRIVHALPMISALVIIAMGLWLCTKTL